MSGIITVKLSMTNQVNSCVMVTVLILECLSVLKSKWKKEDFKGKKVVRFMLTAGRADLSQPP